MKIGDKVFIRVPSMIIRKTKHFDGYILYKLAIDSYWYKSYELKKFVKSKGEKK